MPRARRARALEGEPSGGIKTQRGVGPCAMVAPGPRMRGDFVSTFRGVLDGNPMDHGEVPNIFQ